ncbi:hypothetical protein MC7420_2916 [Coleofasciculus chthonoplastes PCC 7420]|uniref:PEP-CTERM exosortase interaction domain protein n=1 Tax=Coleofasciculus chthonoplastes PCC 7420 TaxID=118168 RepID=B4VJQ3_9CYAN|nr:hypothetical protein [Coleofasciculus chthonoplastes]EDX77592.1 hypothetical protein MC7420_2916 [Coleofasciculus chthonoplastes PCC 7420]
MFNKLSTAILGASLVSLGVINPVQALTIIDTCKFDCGRRAFGPFGEGSFLGSTPLTVNGQTFTVPDFDHILTEFSFLLSDPPAGAFSPVFGNELDVIDFRAFVMRWDDIGNRPIGSILFESETRSTTVQDSTFPLEKFTFSPGGLSLTSGGKYVVFLSVLKDLDGLPGLGWFGEDIDSSSGQPVGTYSGGDSVYRQISSFDSIRNIPWVVDSRRDAAFQATFISKTTVFEPNFTLGLLFFGVLGATSALKSKNK